MSMHRRKHIRSWSWVLGPGPWSWVLFLAPGPRSWVLVLSPGPGPGSWSWLLVLGPGPQSWSWVLVLAPGPCPRSWVLVFRYAPFSRIWWSHTYILSRLWISCYLSYLLIILGYFLGGLFLAYFFKNSDAARVMSYFAARLARCLYAFPLPSLSPCTQFSSCLYPVTYFLLPSPVSLLLTRSFDCVTGVTV